MSTTSGIGTILQNAHFRRTFPFISAGISFKQAWPRIGMISGWLASPHQEQWLFEAVRRLPRTANILEIGSFQGRSTVSMALACLGTGRRVFAIDTFRGNDGDFICGRNEVEWQGESFLERFVANLESSGVRSYVVPLVGPSQDIGRSWLAPIDLLFVDGSHDYEDVLSDWNSFFPHVVSGGVVAFHDVTPEWDGPHRAWHEHIKPCLRDIGCVSTLAYGTKP